MSSEIKNRLIPVSITIRLKHLELIERKTKEGSIKNTSEYIRSLIDKDLEEQS